MTGDQNTFHNFYPKTEQHRMESAFPKRKKAMIILSAGKVTGRVFWDAERCMHTGSFPVQKGN
jgi:hypothetical protein